MRILHVIGEMGYGGAELLTSLLARNFNNSNYNTSIAVIGPCEKELVDLCKRSGVKVIQFRARLISPLNVLRLVALIRNDRFDLVHVHLFPSLYWGAISSYLVSEKVRWIYTEHSTHNSRRERPFLRSLECWAYNRYNRVVCISNDVKKELKSWLPRLNNSEVIENGIEIQRFSSGTPLPRVDLSLAESDKVVLMVGAFRQEKNHAGLIRAFALLPADFRLVLAGDGPERLNIESLVGRLGIGPRVRFLGAFSNVERLMKMADVYVLPSFFEGFGLSAMEAIAAGLPVIYADVPGLSKVLDKAGLPVDPTSDESIALGILKLTNDNKLRNECVKHGNKILPYYSIERFFKRYESVYLGVYIK